MLKFTQVKIGLGKSTLIKNTFSKENEYKEYENTYFPLGEDINRNEIIQKLL